ncbi:MAG: hypothetical protein IIZ48_01680 [Erysipelotrichales bacterium]|nr:hypothetical protein [Erysipelotrichales bacterium]
MFAGIISFLGSVIWTVIKIAAVLLVIFIIWHFVTLKKAIKVKDEIDKDPEAYFAKQEEERKKKINEENGVIDADFRMTSNEKVDEEE